MKKSNRIKRGWKIAKAEKQIQNSKIKAYGLLFFAFLFLIIASYFLTHNYSIFNLF